MYSNGLKRKEIDMSKKIMFNDKYGLTQAVLDGRKTMTRRVITYPSRFRDENIAGLYRYGIVLGDQLNVVLYDADERLDSCYISPRYKVGEVVAIAQSYSDCGNMPDYGLDEDGYPIMLKISGFFNKMFVRADLMPHHIRITNIKIKRLQDISDGDCLKEGIYKLNSANGNGGIAYSFVGASSSKHIGLYASPREAFAALIDKVSGKGTWESNPYVFAYEFELID